MSELSELVSVTESLLHGNRGDSPRVHKGDFDTKSGFQVTPYLSANLLPSGGKGRWETSHLITSAETGDIMFARLTSDYGDLIFAKWSDGHQGWRWAETGGGGSVTILYSIVPEKGLVVALIREPRANMGPDMQWCAPGGFKKKPETHAGTQSRESMQETGIDTSDANRLLGLPINANRNYFIADVAKGEGIHFYEFEIPHEFLVEAGGGYGVSVKISDLKNPENLLLTPWEDAMIHTPDACAATGIGRLLSWLKKSGNLSFIG